MLDATATSQFLDKLPNELIVRTLGELDAFNLTRCRLVCKLLHDIIAETARLSYDIELAVAGQEDGLNSKLSAMEKLELLKNHQSRWAELEWNTGRRYPMKGAGLWELFGNVLAQNTPDGSFAFVQLPSEYRNIPERQWTVKPATPQFVRDFGMDPSQDLLVLIEMPRWSAGIVDWHHRIYIRTLSTAKKHPLATGSGLIKHLRSSFDPNTSYSIQISLDFLAIFFHATTGLAVNEFVIWEWKTGQKKLHLIGNDLESFCFLSQSHVLLTLTVDLPDGSNRAELLVVDFEQEDYYRKVYLNITHGFKLSLPTFHSSVVLRSFTVRSDPPPSRAPHSDLQAPFYIAQDAKVFVVSIWVHKDTLRHLTLVLPQSTLLYYKNLSGPISDETTLPWEAWGPQGSRMTEIFTRNPAFEVWACYVYGTKFVLSECSPRTNHKFILQILDFNQKSIRNAISQGQKISQTDIMHMESLTCNSSLCVTAPNVFPAKDIFEQEIRTALPYRWIARTMPFIHANCSSMCSEDSIIVVDPSEETGYYNVYSF